MFGFTAPGDTGIREELPQLTRAPYCYAKAGAFSRPVRPLSRLGYPLVRPLQGRCPGDSHAATARAAAI